MRLFRILTKFFTQLTKMEGRSLKSAEVNKTLIKTFARKSLGWQLGTYGVNRFATYSGVIPAQFSNGSDSLSTLDNRSLEPYADKIKKR